MSDLMDFDRVLTENTVTELRLKLEVVDMFCFAKTNQNFEFLAAYNPMNNISLSCPMYVDGKNSTRI